MNMKVIGAIATIASFGVGMIIPNVAGASVGSYEEALAIVEGANASGKEQAKEGNETELAKDNAADEASKAEAEASEEKEQKADKGASSEDKEKPEVSAAINPNADVVFDWTFDDIKINGIKLVESDYDSVVDSFGLDKTMIEYTDGGFKLNTDGYECLGKMAWLSGTLSEGKGKSTSLYWDGEKYVTNQLEEMEPNRLNFSLSGVWGDRDSSSDYWSLSYTSSNQNDRLQEEIWVGNLEHGLSDSDVDEISKIISVPFIGGDYSMMNEIFHTDEIIEKGLKDETNASQGSERYIVDTSIGKCTFDTNTFDSNGKKRTSYNYSFDSMKYRATITFTDGVDIATGIGYAYYH